MDIPNRIYSPLQIILTYMYRRYKINSPISSKTQRIQKAFLSPHIEAQ